MHQNFFSNLHAIDAFLVGCGSVGKELLAQIARQQAALLKKNISLKVYGIANSQKLLLQSNGIDLSASWQEDLDKSDKQFSIDNLKGFVHDNSLVNPVVIDCTSSAYIAEQYPQMMLDGFHVVTPNKKANTASTEFYQLLRDTAQKTNRQFLYETTVGAGLPVIDNLQNLFYAGDELVRFEGILSGSLSFVFGNILI